MLKYPLTSLVALSMLLSVIAAAQPRWGGEGVVFTIHDPAARTVSLVGDFNGWAKEADPLHRDTSGTWSVTRHLSAGAYQYKFLVDGEQYVLDPGNAAQVENYNNSSKNSTFVLTEDRRVLLTVEARGPAPNARDEYHHPPGKNTVYLNIVWHQHQPLYVNPETDQLAGPWVRTHATKDYYDMAAMVRAYPNIHCTINLTSSLLLQLKTYYVDRLAPFLKRETDRIDVPAFWSRWKGKTDPWIDLALKPTAKFNSTDRAYLYRNAWNAFGMSEIMLERFPEYRALRAKLPTAGSPPDNLYSEQEMREIKFWFFLAYFDPDFLLGPVVLPDRGVCDLSMYVRRGENGTYRLKRAITEDDCNHVVADAVKVMANIIPIHRELRYEPARGTGQIEIITTPFYHPILPLIYDSDIARVCQPGDSLPSRFSYPEDAMAQVAKSVALYHSLFGANPQGMWPGEGSLSQDVLPLLRSNGILWSATDVRVLQRSDPPNQPNSSPYRFPAGDGKWISLVFRDTELSDRIGFKYQTYAGEEAAEDFVRTILARSPREGEPDVLVTVILDGENAWEWYRKDPDGKTFLNSLYRKLGRLYGERQIVTVTPSEYIAGNPARGVPPHPVEQQPAMNRLWPGSWIDGNFATWIGEREENTAWEYLLRARKDLESSGLKAPDPAAPLPGSKTKSWYAAKAWEAIYAAEGSDWFWWFGDDQTAPGGDKPYEAGFLTHLRNMYRFANEAGAHLSVPEFAPIIVDQPQTPTGGGTMALGSQELQTIILRCDARGLTVPIAIYVAGSIPALGDWTPNLIAMRDDGTAGDDKAGDGIWSLQLDVPVGKEVQYKYTNSGTRGEWIPGEEFPQRNRHVTITARSATPTIINDIYGK